MSNLSINSQLDLDGQHSPKANGEIEESGATDHLTPASLECALVHLARFGDSDAFPKGFEFGAIGRSWKQLRRRLAAVDLGNYRAKASRRILVPKSTGGYRRAAQLEPVDALLYTAMVHDAAEGIENHRIAPQRAIACSYRIKLDQEGSFFSGRNEWAVYRSELSRLSKKEGLTHVVSTDIVDFYNQVSHPRLALTLRSAGIPASRTRNLLKFLADLNGTDRGLPVGPSASIVLGEACLDAADKFLISQGFTHIRYVDDIKIFCDSRRNATDALYQFSKYVQADLQLMPAQTKSRIQSVRKFIQRELEVHPDEQCDATRGEFQQLLRRIEGTGYEYRGKSKGKSEAKRGDAEEDLIAIFEDALRIKPLQLGLVRYILRRARRLQDCSLQEAVFDNFDRLAPAMPELIEYLAGSTKPETLESIGNTLLERVSSSPAGVLPFVVLWVLEFFVRRPVKSLYGRVFEMALNASSSLGIRPLALLAQANGHVEWIRAERDKWIRYPSWDRRAILFSCSVLSDTEKRLLHREVKRESTDPLDLAIAELVASG